MGTEKETKTEQEINELIDGLCLLDDNLMNAVFDGNIEATQLVLNIILNRKDLIVKDVAIQKLEKNPLYNGRDVKIDILAEDSEGSRYDIEIQRADEGAGLKRARFLSAALDQRMLKHSQEFKEIKDSYVIFITENDVLKGNLPLYHFERHCIELRTYANDGNHIIYANGAYEDNTTEIGRLMHDFRCKNPEDMYNEPLRKAVHHFKKTKGGREQMSKDIEKYGDERAIESAVNMGRKMKMPEQQIEDYLVETFKLTKEEAEKYLEPVSA